MKTRTITLYKDELLYDIEGLAYKFTEGTGLEGKAKNTVAADHNETLDERLLTRMIKSRIAQIKDSLTFALTPMTQDSANNIPANENEFVISLSLADKFNDNSLDILQTKTHDYVVRGVLLDWYKRLGIQTLAVDGGEVLELEEAIVSIARTPSYTKRPLQPFGPRK